MKKSISVLLAVIMAITCIPTAFAAANGIWVVQYDENNKVYLQNTETNESIYAAVEVKDGIQRPVDLEEYVIVLNNAEYVDTEAVLSNEYTYEIQSLSHTYYSYTQKSKSKVNGTPKKVTQDIKGPASVSHGTSTSISESFSASVSLGVNQKSAIRQGASFTWNTSSSSSTSFGVTFPVPSGKTGYVQFTPYLNRTTGELWATITNGTTITKSKISNITAHSPIKVGSTADGLFELRIK